MERAKIRSVIMHGCCGQSNAAIGSPLKTFEDGQRPSPTKQDCRGQGEGEYGEYFA